MVNWGEELYVGVFICLFSSKFCDCSFLSLLGKHVRMFVDIAKSACVGCKARYNLESYPFWLGWLLLLSFKDLSVYAFIGNPYSQVSIYVFPNVSKWSQKISQFSLQMYKIWEMLELCSLLSMTPKHDWGQKKTIFKICCFFFIQHIKFNWALQNSDSPDKRSYVWRVYLNFYQSPIRLFQVQKDFIQTSTAAYLALDLIWPVQIGATPPPFASAEAGGPASADTATELLDDLI